MIALLLVEMFHRVAQGDAGHDGGVLVQELQEAWAVFVAGEA